MRRLPRPTRPATRNASPSLDVAHITFDFDGTLVQSNAIKRQTYYDVVPPGADHAFLTKLIDNAALNRHQVFASFAEHLGHDPRDAAEWAELYDVATRRAVTNCPEVDGATATLEALTAAGHRLYLVSATPTEPLTAIADARAMSGHFDRVLGSPTPKHQHIADICAATGTDVAEVIHVGDQLADRQAAAAAGCRFIAVTAAGGAFAPPEAVPLHAVPTIVAGDSASA